jgi:hypothetical protein
MKFFFLFCEKLLNFSCLVVLFREVSSMGVTCPVVMPYVVIPSRVFCPPEYLLFPNVRTS